MTIGLADDQRVKVVGDLEKKFKKESLEWDSKWQINVYYILAMIQWIKADQLIQTKWTKCYINIVIFDHRKFAFIFLIVWEHTMRSTNDANFCVSVFFFWCFDALSLLCCCRCVSYLSCSDYSQLIFNVMFIWFSSVM